MAGGEKVDLSFRRSVFNSSSANHQSGNLTLCTQVSESVCGDNDIQTEDSCEVGVMNFGGGGLQA